MPQLYVVLAALIGGVLLTLYVELRARADRERRKTRDCEPVFQMLRNGRVRFDFEDLLRADQSTPGERYRRDHAMHSGLEHTIPDVLGHRGPPQ